jgi:hypothetical protein
MHSYLCISVFVETLNAHASTTAKARVLVCPLCVMQLQHSARIFCTRLKWILCWVVLCSARNGHVYAGIPYRNFMLLNFIPTLTNIQYIHLSFFYSSYGINCFAFKYICISKFQLRTLILCERVREMQAAAVLQTLS